MLMCANRSRRRRRPSRYICFSSFAPCSLSAYATTTLSLYPWQARQHRRASDADCAINKLSPIDKLCSLACARAKVSVWVGAGKQNVDWKASTTCLSISLHFNDCSRDTNKGRREETSLI